MIYDTLNNLPNYLGMSDNLDAVIEFVMARDINNLPAGKDPHQRRQGRGHGVYRHAADLGQGALPAPGRPPDPRDRP